MAVADPSQIGGGCGGSEPTMTTTEAETETDITVARRGGKAHGPPSRPWPNVPMMKTTTAAIRRRRPPHMMLVFSRFPLKRYRLKILLKLWWLWCREVGWGEGLSGCLGGCMRRLARPPVFQNQAA